jgi:hypothetical protein
MSLTLDQARGAVHTVVAAVPALAGVPVYDYVRHVTTEEEIASTLVGGGRLHFWCVVPAAQNPVTIFRPVGSACDQAKPYLFDIHGFYALKDADASEKAFLTIAAGSVLEALRTTRHVTGDIGCGPPQWPENDHRMLASVFVHHVRITFPVVAALP